MSIFRWVYVRINKWIKNYRLFISLFSSCRDFFVMMPFHYCRNGDSRWLMAAMCAISGRKSRNSAGRIHFSTSHVWQASAFHSYPPDKSEPHSAEIAKIFAVLALSSFINFSTAEAQHGRKFIYNLPHNVAQSNSIELSLITWLDQSLISNSKTYQSEPFVPLKYQWFATIQVGLNWIKLD